MKISGARADPFAARRRAVAGAGAVSPATAPEQAPFLGVPETELTPAVQGAIAMLAVELDDLRAEVKRLKARLLDAEAAADEDPLTKVKNRRAFLRELRRIAAFAQRYETPAALIYFDLDSLKAINDRFGHAAGDAALVRVSGLLAAHVRENDVIGRLGGDEFAVALAQADAASAAAKAQALADLVAARPLEIGEWLAPIRVSWGASRIDPGLDPEAIVAEADAAMFAMKRAQRPRP
jgi:diguanylate cyclase (GGDEF)-like protein